MFVINTPLIFRGIWAAVQPLLQERTRKKITILGSDFLPTLTQMVPLEHLPDIFRGKMRLDPYKSVGPWQQHETLQEEQVAETCAGSRVQMSTCSLTMPSLDKANVDKLSEGESGRPIAAMCDGKT